MDTLAYMIEMRRHLHRMPELSLQEKETAAFIREPIPALTPILSWIRKNRGSYFGRTSTLCR